MLFFLFFLIGVLLVLVIIRKKKDKKKKKWIGKGNPKNYKHHNKGFNKLFQPKKDTPELLTVLQDDFRDKSTKEKYEDSQYLEKISKKPLKFVTYNVEMCKRLEEIISDLKKMDADVICLQEVENNSPYSGYAVSSKEIAHRLKMNSMFIVEKYAKSNLLTGYRGNSVLTKFSFETLDFVRFDCVKAKFHHIESIEKIHCSPCPIIKISNELKIRVSSLHLDPEFTGRKNRVKQMKMVFKEVSKLDEIRKEKMKNEKRQERLLNIFAGDLNTMTTGVARLWYGKYAPDLENMIGNHFGVTEAEYFQEKLISRTNYFDPFEKKAWFPFWFNKDHTLSHKNVYAAKLDWVLFPKGEIEILSKKIITGASDHKLVFVEFQFTKNF